MLLFISFKGIVLIEFKSRDPDIPGTGDRDWGLRVRLGVWSREGEALGRESKSSKASSILPYYIKDEKNNKISCYKIEGKHDVY